MGLDHINNQNFSSGQWAFQYGSCHLKGSEFKFSLCHPGASFNDSSQGEMACNVGSSHPVGGGFKDNSDCIQNCLIGEMCTVPNIGVEIESSAEWGSEIVSVNILCKESHTAGAKFYEDLDCDQNCFISETCVAPGVGVDKESSSELRSEIESASIIVLKEGAEVRILLYSGSWHPSLCRVIISQNVKLEFSLEYREGARDSQVISSIWASELERL